MQQYVTSCTGSSQTLTPTIDEKVKVYCDYATACACIACIAEGEIVSTKSDRLLDMDAVKEYVKDQNRLSDIVDMSSCIVTDASTFAAPYDGVLSFRGYANAVNGYICIAVNGCAVGQEQSGSGGTGAWFTTTATVNKGDLINARKYCGDGYLLARWYCDRDYN